MKVLVTGAAGFCGMHVATQLLDRGEEVTGFDNLNSYYDPRLKQARLAQIGAQAGFSFVAGDVGDMVTLLEIFAQGAFDRVVHLAAQPGVRYSLQNPGAYIQSNVVGFANVLEACRQHEIGHLVYASSSSVYGANTKVPFAEADNVDHPVSLYAATKKSNELLAHSYSHLFGLPTTGLRFFTVYGPWGRPDMSPWLFTDAILAGRPIKVFNYGKMQRDFTFVEDIAEATVRVLDAVPTADPSYVHDGDANPALSHAPYRVFNVGNERPVELLHFIGVIERALGREAVKEFLPMQPGDLEVTRADVSALRSAIGYAPETPIEVGIPRWVDWFRAYHRSA
jgi:UDP-glucuronate 4-epimerase